MALQRVLNLFGRAQTELQHPLDNYVQSFPPEDRDLVGLMDSDTKTSVFASIRHALDPYNFAERITYSGDSLCIIRGVSWRRHLLYQFLPDETLALFLLDSLSGDLAQFSPAVISCLTGVQQGFILQLPQGAGSQLWQAYLEVARNYITNEYTDGAFYFGPDAAQGCFEYLVSKDGGLFAEYRQFKHLRPYGFAPDPYNNYHVAKTEPKSLEEVEAREAELDAHLQRHIEAVRLTYLLPSDCFNIFSQLSLDAKDLVLPRYAQQFEKERTMQPGRLFGISSRDPATRAFHATFHAIDEDLDLMVSDEAHEKDYEALKEAWNVYRTDAVPQLVTKPTLPSSNSSYSLQPAAGKTQSRAGNATPSTSAHESTQPAAKANQQTASRPSQSFSASTGTRNSTAQSPHANRQEQPPTSSHQGESSPVPTSKASKSAKPVSAAATPSNKTGSVPSTTASQTITKKRNTWDLISLASDSEGENDSRSAKRTKEVEDPLAEPSQAEPYNPDDQPWHLDQYLHRITHSDSAEYKETVDNGDEVWIGDVKTKVDAFWIASTRGAPPQPEFSIYEDAVILWAVERHGEPCEPAWDDCDAYHLERFRRGFFKPADPMNQVFWNFRFRKSAAHEQLYKRYKHIRELAHQATRNEGNKLVSTNLIISSQPKPFDKLLRRIHLAPKTGQYEVDEEMDQRWIKYVQTHNKTWEQMIPRLKLLPEALRTAPPEDALDDTMEEPTADDLLNTSKKGAALRAEQTAQYRERMNEDATVSIQLRHASLEVLNDISTALKLHSKLLVEAMELLREFKRDYKN